MLRALLALMFVFAALAPNASAQPAPVAAAEWYYVSGNQVQGPHTLDEMQTMTARGIIRPTTQVYDPAAGWAFARDTPALRAHLVDAAPAPSRPPPPVSGPGSAAGQQMLDDEARAFLLGGWRMVTTESMAGRRFESTVRYEFRADGNYAGSLSTRMPDSPDLPPLTEPLQGAWSVRALNAGEFLITLDTGFGLPPETLALAVENDDTLVTTDGRHRYERVR